MAWRNRRMSGNGSSSTERSRPRKPICRRGCLPRAPQDPGRRAADADHRHRVASRDQGRAQHQDLPFGAAAVQAAHHQGEVERAFRPGGPTPMAATPAMAARGQQAKIEGRGTRSSHRPPPPPGDGHIGQRQRPIADRGGDAGAANAHPRQEDQVEGDVQAQRSQAQHAGRTTCPSLTRTAPSGLARPGPRRPAAAGAGRHGAREASSVDDRDDERRQNPARDGGDRRDRHAQPGHREAETPVITDPRRTMCGISAAASGSVSSQSSSATVVASAYRPSCRNPAYRPTST